ASRQQKAQLKTRHKSIGLTATRRRLEMLAGGESAGKVEIAEVKDPSGKVLGTQAEIWIPIA
ncbi:MAG: hypothetical protein KDC54_03850, partial [Lewinella sp.]|nr:hypothetical protein [Lewinella sp.]